MGPIFNPDIVGKWRAEALAVENIDITEKMVDWCIAELQHKAKDFEETWSISVYDGDVVKSDQIVPESLKQALKAAAAPLEQVPAREQDWRPGYHGTVLDLVHPSLFPLIYGHSKILPDSSVGLDDCISRSGEGQIIPVPFEENTPPRRALEYETEYQYSYSFQWLPCNVEFDGNEGAVKIVSYSNKLHPKRHRDLYAVLEKLIERAIPLWNRALTPLARQASNIFPPPRIEYYECEYDPDPENGPETDGPQRADYETERRWQAARTAWYAATRRVVQPEPDVFVPPTKEQERNGKVVDLFRDYADVGLQIIIKLENIHLTPEKPQYKGGIWRNEHICASAIYCYDSDNITPSQLAFRQQSDTDTSDITHRKNQYGWLRAVFGCSWLKPAVQNVGKVETREGRLLVWPNILQHRVEPFKLADESKPGHRKIVAMFLVDPAIKIISTANVPCQQAAWWRDAVLDELEGSSGYGGKGLAGLPQEIKDQIFNDVDDFPISVEEAKEFRLELMEERRKFAALQRDVFKEHEFSLSNISRSE
ncbi:hypothetical protein H0H81_004816 [Sphagnurus paluster]|uniref:DUF4246 domain-containing protein n=1 Tax=Sphagnurus paluster TaxID=117069 RepID=A0A9P7GQ01_9AGAR|nr:hypothetical protein H0H81_004816 [Sphagnurus paluster]